MHSRILAIDGQPALAQATQHFRGIGVACHACTSLHCRSNERAGLRLATRVRRRICSRNRSSMNRTSLVGWDRLMGYTSLCFYRRETRLNSSREDVQWLCSPSARVCDRESPGPTIGFYTVTTGGAPPWLARRNERWRGPHPSARSCALVRVRLVGSCVVLRRARPFFGQHRSVAHPCVVSYARRLSVARLCVVRSSAVRASCAAWTDPSSACSRIASRSSTGCTATRSTRVASAST